MGPDEAKALGEAFQAWYTQSALTPDQVAVWKRLPPAEGPKLLVCVAGCFRAARGQ